ncbi:MAG: zinc transporter, ATP-binding protein [Rickettsiaceae bacterium]|jgi:zinc transport system ATP-binding protein|nr:zinc transporter, ATP-binding protein [Rickettsiaceae bacterium]
MSNALIKLTNVSQAYENKLVLHNISLEILPNTITTVIGPNGAGKTTLARIIIGIDKPVNGSVYRKLGLKISYIPQKLALDRNLPLDIKSFLELLGQSQACRELIEEALDEVSLELPLSTSVHALSGGQFQKIMLAAALLNKPDLIVMDEATQGLDVTSQANFYKIIERVKNEHNHAIFMISHDLFTVMSRSEQVICLNKHICCNGLPNQIVNNPEYIKIFGRKEDILSIYSHNHDHHHN